MSSAGGSPAKRRLSPDEIASAKQPRLASAGERTHQPILPVLTVEQFKRRYTLVRRLGRGAYGIVSLAKDTRDGRAVAVKMMVQHTGVMLSAIAKQVRHEIALITRLHHPALVQYYDAYEVGANDVVVVMEYVDGGDLYHLNLPTNKLNPMYGRLFWRAAAQLFAGLAYLHACGVAHRDIKPDNVLVRKNVADEPTAFLLSDFADACLSDVASLRALQNVAGSASLSNETCDVGQYGTIAFRSPELRAAYSTARGEPVSPDMWRASDVWALLLTLFSKFFMIDMDYDAIDAEVNRISATDLRQQQITSLILRKTNGYYDSDNIWYFLSECLQWQYTERPSAEKIQIDAQKHADKPRQASSEPQRLEAALAGAKDQLKVVKNTPSDALLRAVLLDLARTRTELFDMQALGEGYAVAFITAKSPWGRLVVAAAVPAATNTAEASILSEAVKDLRLSIDSYQNRPTDHATFAARIVRAAPTILAAALKTPKNTYATVTAAVDKIRDNVDEPDATDADGVGPLTDAMRMIIDAEPELQAALASIKTKPQTPNLTPRTPKKQRAEFRTIENVFGESMPELEDGDVFSLMLHERKLLPFLYAVIKETPQLDLNVCVPTGHSGYVQFNDFLWYLPDGEGLVIPYKGGNPKLYSSEKVLRNQAGFIEVFTLKEGTAIATLPPVVLQTLKVWTNPETGKRYTFYLSFNPNLANLVEKQCEGKRFVLLILGMSTEEQVGHALAIVLDLEEHTLQIMDPNGSAEVKKAPYAWFTDMLVFYGNWLAAVLFKNLNLHFVEMREACPITSVQFKQQKSSKGGGYCVAWSAYLLLSRVINPTWSAYDVQTELLKIYEPSDLKWVIRRFIKWIDATLLSERTAHGGSEWSYPKTSSPFATNKVVPALKKLQQTLGPAEFARAEQALSDVEASVQKSVFADALIVLITDIARNFTGEPPELKKIAVAYAVAFDKATSAWGRLAVAAAAAAIAPGFVDSQIIAAGILKAFADARNDRPALAAGIVRAAPAMLAQARSQSNLAVVVAKLSEDLRSLDSAENQRETDVGPRTAAMDLLIKEDPELANLRTTQVAPNETSPRAQPPAKQGLGNFNRGLPRINNDDLKTLYEFVEQVGQGGYGTVYSARDHQRGDEIVAIKCIGLGDGPLDAEKQHDIDVTQHEVALMTRLRHPSLVPCLAAYNLEDEEILIVMPFLPDGDLSKLPLPPKRNAGFARLFWAASADLFGALAYLHLHGVAHRDIKPPNILIQMRAGDVPRFLLADYGFSCIMDLDKLRDLQKMPSAFGDIPLSDGLCEGGPGSPRCMAPEVQIARNARASDTDPVIFAATRWAAADVWSLALSLFLRFFVTSLPAWDAFFKKLFAQPDRAQGLLAYEVGRLVVESATPAPELYDAFILCGIRWRAEDRQTAAMIAAQAEQRRATDIPSVAETQYKQAAHRIVSATETVSTSANQTRTTTKKAVNFAAQAVAALDGEKDVPEDVRVSLKAGIAALSDNINDFSNPKIAAAFAESMGYALRGRRDADAVLRRDGSTVLNCYERAKTTWGKLTIAKLAGDFVVATHPDKLKVLTLLADKADWVRPSEAQKAELVRNAPRIITRAFASPDPMATAQAEVTKILDPVGWFHKLGKQESGPLDIGSQNRAVRAVLAENA